MKSIKHKLFMISVLLLCTIFTACGTSYQEATGEVSTANDADMCNGYFTVITTWGDAYASYYIVYANDTKVKYFIATTSYKYGITPLYNSDGSLQVYEEENEDKDDVEE